MALLTYGDGVQERTLKRSSRERTYLYFGNDWFAENRTSSHHIARWLARDHRVYYVECPGLRAPKTSGRDLKKSGPSLVRFIKGPRSVGENVQVLTLLQVPLHRFRLVRWLNRALILATLRWLMWREGIRHPITWFMVPHLSSVVGRLAESALGLLLHRRLCILTRCRCKGRSRHGRGADAQS